MSEPIRRIRVTPPLQIRRTGDTVWLSEDGDGGVILAELVEAQSYTEGGSNYDCFSWRELVPAPYGQFEASEGGRAGDKDQNPAFGIGPSASQAEAGDIVFLIPWTVSDRHGLEWGILCGCAYTPQDPPDPPTTEDCRHCEPTAALHFTFSAELTGGTCGCAAVAFFLEYEEDDAFACFWRGLRVGDSCHTQPFAAELAVFADGSAELTITTGDSQEIVYTVGAGAFNCLTGATMSLDSTTNNKCTWPGSVVVEAAP